MMGVPGVSTTEELDDQRLLYLFETMGNRMENLKQEAYEVYAEMGAELIHRGFDVKIKS